MCQIYADIASNGTDIQNDCSLYIELWYKKYRELGSGHKPLPVSDIEFLKENIKKIGRDISKKVIQNQVLDCCAT